MIMCVIPGPSVPEVAAISPVTRLKPSAAAQVPVFEIICWNTRYGQGTDPDTLLYGFIDFFNHFD